MKTILKWTYPNDRFLLLESENNEEADLLIKLGKMKPKISGGSRDSTTKGIKVQLQISFEEAEE